MSESAAVVETQTKQKTVCINTNLICVQMEEVKDVLDESRHLIATQLQVAMINKMLPKGFKFESFETVKRQLDQAKQQAKVPVNKRRKVITFSLISLQTQEEKETKKKEDSNDSAQINKRQSKTPVTE